MQTGQLDCPTYGKKLHWKIRASDRHWKRLDVVEKKQKDNVSKYIGN